MTTALRFFVFFYVLGFFFHNNHILKTENTSFFVFVFHISHMLITTTPLRGFALFFFFSFFIVVFSFCLETTLKNQSLEEFARVLGGEVVVRVVGEAVELNVLDLRQKKTL